FVHPMSARRRMSADAGEENSDSIEKKVRGLLSADERRAIFDEIAGVGTDTSALYWMVLVLAGAIALLGLALNSAAVVIGAMLIAPLLAPVLGLALGLAVGDGRLAVQTALAVLASTIAVVAISSLVTVLLPFHEVTAEILGRTKPTTLDLAIAVFSGLAGALVKLSRGDRLAGAVPGVAVSVALVPPLAVTGFGIGIGWDWPVIRGSLLLYGANLAGIVMSAMIVFLVAGMHRPEVLDEVRRWYRETQRSGLAALVDRAPGIRSMGVLKSIPARLGLVLVFVALVAIPLSASLKQITRETRVHRAVEAASKPFGVAGHSFIVSREVNLGADRTQVILNVATTRWFDDSARGRFEQRASAMAREPVDLVLEQLPASSQSLGHLTSMIEARDPARPVTARPDTMPPPASASVAATRGAVARAVGVVTLPDSLIMLGFVVSVSDDSTAPMIRLRYLSRDTLTSQAREIVRHQLANALQLPALTLETMPVSAGPRDLGAHRTATVDTLASLLRAVPSARLSISAGTRLRGARTDSVMAQLAAAGIAANRISLTRVPGDRLEAIFIAQP
ncbi:MAG: TIGR00341 family protein, partial [Gemmatimonadota bacterium]